WAGSRGVQNIEDLRVQGRFAAGQLQEVGLPLALDEEVEHGFNFHQTALPLLLRRGTGKAGRARQVAVLVDFDQREAAVLLVVRAYAAIVGRALVDPGMELERPIARLQKIAATLPVPRLAGDQRLLDAVLGAALQVIDRAALLDDLRRDKRKAGLAERGRLAEKDVGPGLARRRLPLRAPSGQCGVGQVRIFWRYR